MSRDKSPRCSAPWLGILVLVIALAFLLKKRKQSAAVTPLVMERKRTIARFDVLPHAILGDEHSCFSQQLSLRNDLQSLINPLPFIRRIKKDQIECLAVTR